MAHKTPGKYYRKGMSLIEIFQMFPDDATSEKWFVDVRWPDGVRYPHCGSTNVQTGAKHKTMPYRCRDKVCGKRFSAKSKTLIESANLGYQTCAIATYLLTTSLKSVSSMKLHRDLDITQKTAWNLAHRIRKSFETEDHNFDGVIEVDESYFGGWEKNKLRDKKLNEGRGTVGKTAVVGANDRDSTQVVAKVVEDTNRKTLHGFIDDNVTLSAIVCTDDSKSNRKLHGYDHQFVKHSVGEYVDGEIHINRMESFWSILKRVHQCTFQRFSKKHLDRYVTEFEGKHNIRNTDTIRQMESIARGWWERV